MKNISKFFKFENMLHLMAFVTLTITTLNVNTTCAFVIHQPKLPENAKNLRKF